MLQTTDTDHTVRLGVAGAIVAFLIWGFSPLYYKLLGSAPALEIVAHRALWSLLFTLLLIGLSGQLRKLLRLFANPRILFILLVSSLLVSVNWLGFIWAVNNGRALEASMGYYIMPIVMVLLGRVFLDERLNRSQLLSLFLVCLGVLNLLIAIRQLPWIALMLATSFGLYSLVRKKVAVSALIGLTMECLILSPLALGYLLYLHLQESPIFNTLGIGFDLLMVGTGLMTALPLLLFTSASKHLRLGTVGLIQYLNPTCQFLVALFIFSEPFSQHQLNTFLLIWLGLAIYTLDSRRQGRRQRIAKALAETPK